MSAKQLQSWLLQYAFRKKYHKLIQEFSPKLLQGLTTEEFSDVVPPVLMALCSLHKIVICDFDKDKFSLGISLVKDIFDALPFAAMSYKHYAKVTTGLKMLVLFDMLKKKDKMVLSKLNEYFPRNGISHVKAEKALIEKLNLAQVKFRKFFLNLVCDRGQQAAYMNGQYVTEYGPAFQDRVKVLVKDFLLNVEKLLPLTPIEEISKADKSSALCVLLNELRCPYMQHLLDMLVQVDTLGEEDVRELLAMLCTDSDNQNIADPVCGLLDIIDLDNESEASESILSGQPADQNTHVAEATTPSRDGAQKESATKPNVVSNGESKTNVPRARIYKMKSLTPNRVPSVPASPTSDTERRSKETITSPARPPVASKASARVQANMPSVVLEPIERQSLQTKTLKTSTKTGSSSPGKATTKTASPTKRSKLDIEQKDKHLVDLKKSPLKKKTSSVDGPGAVPDATDRTPSPPSSPSSFYSCQASPQRPVISVRGDSSFDKSPLLKSPRKRVRPNPEILISSESDPDLMASPSKKLRLAHNRPPLFSGHVIRRDSSSSPEKPRPVIREYLSIPEKPRPVIRESSSSPEKPRSPGRVAMVSHIKVNTPVVISVSSSSEETGSGDRLRKHSDDVRHAQTSLSPRQRIVGDSHRSPSKTIRQDPVTDSGSCIKNMGNVEVALSHRYSSNIMQTGENTHLEPVFDKARKKVGNKRETQHRNKPNLVPISSSDEFDALFDGTAPTKQRLPKSVASRNASLSVSSGSLYSKSEGHVKPTTTSRSQILTNTSKNTITEKKVPEKIPSHHVHELNPGSVSSPRGKRGSRPIVSKALSSESTEEESSQEIALQVQTKTKQLKKMTGNSNGALGRGKPKPPSKRQSRGLPDLDAYLQPAGVKLCVVKLYRNKNLDRRVKNSHMMYD